MTSEHGEHGERGERGEAAGPRRSARLAPVGECVDRLAIEPLLAHPGDDLLTVVRRASERPQTRLVGIVDDAGVLIGVVPILRLAESVIAHVVPEVLLADITDLEDVARFSDEVDARTMGDIMLPPAVIATTATVDEAFRLMHRRRLSGLYVLDDEGRPSGYLDLLELAILYADELDLGVADSRTAQGIADSEAAEPPNSARDSASDAQGDSWKP